MISSDFKSTVENSSGKQFRLVTIIPLVIAFVVWIIYMAVTSQWFLFAKNWFMSLTMVFGSFIAGASAEGGGAVAFPAMTLIYRITPAVARNFSLAIQSIGMTAAAWLIIRNRYKIEYKYLVPASIGGTLGIILGTYYLVPLVPVPFVKMLFVTFWLSFGIVLYYINHVDKRIVVNELNTVPVFDFVLLIIVGIFGGGLSSLLGSGLDIFSFSYITMRYHLSEKVATPTSVVIMAINTVIGFLLHILIIGDFGPEEFHYWLVCIPIVVWGAPLGAYFISKRTRHFIARFLYLIISAQFIGAWLIIKPEGSLLYFTAVIFVFGILFFFYFSRLGKKKQLE